MKAKIVLCDGELIICVSLKRLLKQKNVQFNIRFESEETANDLIREKNADLILNDIDLNNLEERLSDLINSKAFISQVGKKHPARQNRYGLTEREKEVLALLTEGLTKQEIADSVSLSFHTVDSHLRNIYKKLNIKSRSQAIAKTINEKLL